MLMPLLFIVPPTVGWSRYKHDVFLLTCSFDFITHTWTNRVFIAYVYIFSVAVPCALIVYARVNIVPACNRYEHVQYDVGRWRADDVHCHHILYQRFADGK